MKILYLNLNLVDISCDDRDNTKEQCSCYVFFEPTKSFNEKTSSKLLLDMGKGPLLPYTYTPSSSTVDVLLHLQYYQRCKSMSFKMWEK